MDDFEAAEMKRELRSTIRAARRQQLDSTDSRRERGIRLASAALDDPDVRAACRGGAIVTCYVSLSTEPPTDLLLDALMEAGATVLLPVIRDNRQLHWARYDGPESLAITAAAKSVGPIREPMGEPLATTPLELTSLSPAVLLLPALAVDGSGARLGQGGGYYDTLLASLPPSHEDGPTRIAIVGPDEVLATGAIPLEPHDQPVDRWIVG